MKTPKLYTPFVSDANGQVFIDAAAVGADFFCLAFEGLGIMRFDGDERTFVTLPDACKFLEIEYRSYKDPEILTKLERLKAIDEDLLYNYELNKVINNETTADCKQTRRRGPEPHLLNAAVKLLRELLQDGPVSAEDITKAFSARGVSYSTLRRASKSLGVKPKKSGKDGPWMWSLPEGEIEG